MSVGFDHGVEDDEQLSQAGCGDEFGCLTLLFESLGEAFDDRVVVFGVEGRHVEDIAEGPASSADGSFAGSFAAIVGVGRHADQGGDLFAIELPEFRQLGDEGHGGDVADAGDGLHEVIALFPVVVGLDEFVDGVIETFQIFRQGFDGTIEALADELGKVLVEPVLLGDAELDELSAAGDELVEFLLFFRDLRERPGVDVMSEAGQSPGIDAVVLAEDAEGLAVVMSLTGINDGDDVTGSHEFADDSTLIGAGGFEDDEASSRNRELREQLPMSLGSVGNRERASFRGNMGVERIFGDVDANPVLNGDFHERIPSLRMRARPGLRAWPALAAVRAEFTRPTTIWLTHDLVGSQGARSVAGRGGQFGFATLSRTDHRVFHLTVDPL